MPESSPSIEPRLHAALSRGLLAATLTCAATAPSAGQGGLPWVTPPVVAPGVTRQLFQSEAAGTTVSYHVFLPPQYAAEPDRCFPVLYWLHGSGAATATVAPTSSHFASAIAEGRIPPMIVVMPNGMQYRMWCDSLDGAVPMETVVIEDLIPVVDATFRTVASREGRILEGFSMGGQGTARLALRRPELFAAASILGAGPMQLDFLEAPAGTNFPRDLRLQIYEQVWGSSPEYYLAQHPQTIAEVNAEAIVAAGLRIRVAVGMLDEMLPPNQAFHEHLLALGIPHEFTTPPGVGHSAGALFDALGEPNWDFYEEVFGGVGTRVGDLNGDHRVDGADIALMLSAWGPCPPKSPCPADLDHDGIVGGADLSILLGAWGE